MATSAGLLLACFVVGLHQAATPGTEAAVAALPLLPHTAEKHLCLFVWRNEAALDQESQRSAEMTVTRSKTCLAVGSLSSHYVCHPLKSSILRCRIKS